MHVQLRARYKTTAIYSLTERRWLVFGALQSMSIAPNPFGTHLHHLHQLLIALLMTLRQIVPFYKA